MMNNEDNNYTKNVSHSSDEAHNRPEIFDSHDIKAPASLLPRLMQRLQVAQQNEQFFTTIATITSLQVALDSADEFVRATAIRRLAQWQGDISSLPVDRLLATLSDTSWMVREATIFTLDALQIEVSHEHQVMVLLDENEFVREAARITFAAGRLVEARATARAAPTIQQGIEMGRRIYHVLHSIDSLFLAIHFSDKRGVFMAGQYPQDDNNNLTYLEQITLQQRKHRRKTLGITGAILAVLVIAGLAFSWFTVEKKLPHTATGHAGNTLDRPIISDTNQAGAPELHWIDGTHISLNDRFNQPELNIWNVHTKAAQQEEIFDLLASYHGQLSNSADSTWSPNGQYVINKSVVSDTPETTTSTPTSYTATIEIWNIVDNHKIVSFSYHEDAASARNSTVPYGTLSLPSTPISPDSTRVAVGQGNGNITLWNLSSGKQIASYHLNSAGINFVQWSSDGQRLLAQSNNGAVDLWNTTTGAKISSFFPPLTRQIIYTSSYPQTIQAIKNVPTTPTLSPDGKRMVGVVGTDTVEVWDANTTKVLNTKQVSHSLLSAGWLSNTRILINIISNVQVWNPDTNQAVLNVPGISQQAGWAFSPSQRYFTIINPSSQTVTIWDTSTGQQVTTLHSGAYFEIIGYQGIVWSPDERYIATLSQDTIHKGLDNVIQIWNAATGKLVMQYHSHANQVQQIVWSPDGKYLASVSKGDLGNVMEVWQAPR